MRKLEATLDMTTGQKQDLINTPWYRFKERAKIKKCIKRLQNKNLIYPTRVCAGRIKFHLEFFYLFRLSRFFLSCFAIVDSTISLISASE